MAVAGGDGEGLKPSPHGGEGLTSVFEVGFSPAKSGFFLALTCISRALPAPQHQQSTCSPQPHR